MSDEGQEEFETEEDYFPYLECKPVTKFTFIHFFLTLIIGFLRTVLEATVDLGNAVSGAEVYTEGKKAFEDEARLEIETITTED